VRHLTRDAQLVVELRQPGGVMRHAFGEKLQRDGLIEREILGSIHVAHAAAAEQRHEPVPAGQHGARNESGRDLRRRRLGAGADRQVVFWVVRHRHILQRVAKIGSRRVGPIYFPHAAADGRYEVAAAAHETGRILPKERGMKNRLIGNVALGAAVVAMSVFASAQGRGGRPASPAGTSAAHVAGKWIDISYGRPIKRARDVFGSGADYGKITHTDGATVWRAGANVTTRLKTEAPLVFNVDGGKTVPAGEYSVFIDVASPTKWTFILSNWAAQTKYDPSNKEALWGSFGYTPDKDVVRVPMKVDTLPFSIEEMSWEFVDVTADGGKLAVMWDKTMASVGFKLGS
jgi:hypothetical protein